jgi:hypothetical protein
MVRRVRGQGKGEAEAHCNDSIQCCCCGPVHLVLPSSFFPQHAVVG